MPQYEIIDSEELRMVKVTLNGDTVRGESGALHYMIGNIEMVTKSTKRRRISEIDGIRRISISDQHIPVTGEVYLWTTYIWRIPYTRVK